MQKDNNCDRRLLCIITRAVVLFLAGGITYALLEILFRGHTHISMLILGGFDFLVIGSFNEHSPRKNILMQSVLGSLVITLSELICGCIVNLWLGLSIWDYSDLPFNFLGQICLYYSLLWIPISFLAVILDDILRCLLFGEEMPSYFGKQKAAD